MNRSGLHFTKGLSALAFLLFIPFLHPVKAGAGEVATRAIAAVKRLQAEGKIGQNPILRLVVKKGNIANFTGDSFELQRQWEDATGVQLDIRVMPQMASLYAMWLTDRDISTQSVSAKGGFSDPYRFNHRQHSPVRDIYSGQLIDSLFAQLELAVPAGTGLPGDTEYISALNRNLQHAATGNITAARAMQLTASAWEEITEKYGRRQQIGHWRVFTSNFPDTQH
jgi:hypothetical protein